MRNCRSFSVITIGAVMLSASVISRASAPDEANPAIPPAPNSATTASIPGYSFRNHVVPVMTKAGCNSGACHGAAAGKNGFKLSLRGYDPEGDYETITRQAAARRVNRTEPAKSLLLLKPTLGLPHMGGRRIEPGSVEYQVLARWIAAGAPAPGAADPRIRQLAVAIGKQTLQLGDTEQLRVTATFSNGTVEDVTRWVRYASADESVASVDQRGLITMSGHGETAVNVSYLSLVGATRVRVPFPYEVPAAVFARAERVNTIDVIALRKLQQLHIAPSPRATDAEFIRRAYLDAAGILPPSEEVTAFVADTNPAKRATLIDRILERPEFVDYWAYKWSDLLLVSSKSLSRNSVKAFYGWIRRSVEVNRPWDRFVRELTTAVGRSDENGAANYFLIHKNPQELMENYTHAFLGLTLMCARCHNHPLEKWTQNDYYGFANLFARVAHKDDDDRVGMGRGDGATIYTAATGDVLHPKTGLPLAPRPLDGVPMPAHAREDRRAYLARWVTSADNTLFARTIVNRVWANFFGRGLVEAVDDLRATNPASNEELFAAISREFVAGGFDIKGLIRTIMSSATYQRSSATNETNAKDDRYYSHYLIRRLPGEVILDGMSGVLGQPETFPGYARGTRALQLPDTRVKSFFLSVFGRPERLVTSAAERMQDPTLPQALHVLNGDTLNGKLKAPAGTIDKLLAMADEDAIDSLYLAAYSRKPSATERTGLLRTLATAAPPTAADPPEKESDRVSPRRAALEDIAWAVLTSKEFLFNH